MTDLLRAVASDRRQRDHLDVTLFGALSVLGLIGSFVIYSATKVQLANAGYNPHYYVERQFGFVVVGIVVMYVLSLLDYRRFDVLATPVYVGSLLALAGVFVLGQSALGAQRWYSLGFVQVQPSEFTVLSVILAAATFCTRRADGLRMYDVLRLLLMCATPIGLIVLQPDLGTSIIIILTVAGMMVIAGVPPRFMTFLAVAGSVGAVAAVYFDLLKKYQVDRFVSFLNQNSKNSSIQSLLYEVSNAKSAIGSGGIFGAGPFHGTMTTLGWVPEQRTDFIFTAVGEQFGFVGSLALLTLIAVAAWRMWAIGRRARDIMGRVLCIGVFVFFSFSAFENIGMTMGITPVTGIPLPLVSYGGSAVLVFYLAGGAVLSVSRRSVAP